MKHYACRRRRERRANYEIDLPGFAVKIPKPQEMAHAAAQDQATTLRKRLSRLTGRYRGLARASVGGVDVQSNEVTLENRPDGSVGRMDNDLGLTTINEATLDGTLRRIIEDSM